MYAIELQNIKKEFGTTPALKNISLTIDHNSIHGLIGPNGAGKTTTMNIIAGLIAPTEGTVRVLEEDPLKSKIIKEEIGLLPQSPPLYGHMAIRDYLKFAGKIKGLNKDLLEKNLKSVAEKCGLSEIMNRKIQNLSGGLAQRVGIAQALIAFPKVIILDEPTNGLDPKSSQEIKELILELKQGHTIIISSHLLHEIELVCDSLTVIHKGEVKASGPIEKIRESLSKSLAVEFKTLRWNEEIASEIENAFQTRSLKVDHKAEGYCGRIEVAKGKEIRPQLSELITSHNLGLLEISQFTLSVEEIFEETTQD